MTADTEVMPAPRRAWIAVVLTILQPGVGHLYAGRLRRGIGFFIALTVLGTITTTLLATFTAGLLLMLLGICGALVYVAALVDSAIVARRAPWPYVLQPFNRGWVYIATLVVGALLAY